MKIFFTKEAHKDVVDVVEYISKNNVEIANDVFDKVWYTCNLIVNMPEMGTTINYIIDSKGVSEQIQEIIDVVPLLEGVRRFPVSGFSKLIIFYKVENKTLKIIRILHGNRDIPAIFMNMFTDVN